MKFFLTTFLMLTFVFSSFPTETTYALIRDRRHDQIDALTVSLISANNTINTMNLTRQQKLPLFTQLLNISTQINTLRAAVTKDLGLERVFVNYDLDSNIANLKYVYRVGTTSQQIKIPLNSSAVDFSRIMDGVRSEVITHVALETGLSPEFLNENRIVFVSAANPISKQVTNIVKNSDQASELVGLATRYSIIDSIRVYPWRVHRILISDPYHGDYWQELYRDAVIEMRSDQGGLVRASYREYPDSDQDGRPDKIVADYEVAVLLSTTTTQKAPSLETIYFKEQEVTPEELTREFTEIFTDSELSKNDKNYPRKFLNFLGRNQTANYANIFWQSGQREVVNQPIAANKCYPARDITWARKGLEFLLNEYGFQYKDLDNIAGFFAPTYPTEYYRSPGCDSSSYF